jgi:hypothetical protein
VSARSLEFVSPGLLALGTESVDGRVWILDVFEATTPTLLGSTEVRRAAHLAVVDYTVYASGNDTLTALALQCE